jgi:hypothetical protein
MQYEAVPRNHSDFDGGRAAAMGWRSREFIENRMAANYVQIWAMAKLVGLVKDKDENGYRCTDMSAKVAALETVVSEAYDPKIKHREYNGTVYVFNAVDGKVDISSALKNGGSSANVVIIGNDPKQPGQK